MNEATKKAIALHSKVPPDWYYRSIKANIGQRFWHKTRFKEVRKVIEPTRGKILDIGCADGVFTDEILTKSGASEIIGIDVLEKSIMWANKHWHHNKKMRFKFGDAHELKFKEDTFDAVFALEVMEHVLEPNKVISDIKRVLRKGGYTVILVPTDNALFNIVWFFWTKFGPGKVWNDAHIQSFNKRNTLADALKNNGFKIVEDKKFLLGMLNVVKARK